MPPIRPTLAAALAALALAAPALAQDEDPYASEDAAAFFAALEAEGLTTVSDLLRQSEATWFLDRDEEDDEEYTLFAPTDDAFAALPAGVLDALLAEEDRVTLSELLEHHLIPAQGVRAADLTDGTELEPATGQDLEVREDAGNVLVSGAQVVGTDIEVADGVVHAIDGVLFSDLVRDALLQRGVLNGED